MKNVTRPRKATRNWIIIGPDKRNSESNQSSVWRLASTTNLTAVKSVHHQQFTIGHVVLTRVMAQTFCDQLARTFASPWWLDSLDCFWTWLRSPFTREGQVEQNRTTALIICYNESVSSVKRSRHVHAKKSTDLPSLSWAILLRECISLKCNGNSLSLHECAC